MKKITSLFAALMAVVAVNAATVTFGSADLSTSAMTKSGVTVTPAKENGQTAPAINTFEGVNTLRVYAKGSLTFDAGTAKITSITLKLNSSTNGKRLTTMTSDAGDVTVTGDPDWTATWTNAGVNKVVFTVGDKATLGSEGDTKAGQIHIMEIIVVTDGEGGGIDPTPTEKVLEANYGQAVYMSQFSEEGAHNWEIDLVDDIDGENYNSWLYLDIYTTSATKLNGTYSTENGTLGVEYSGIDLVTEEKELASAELTLAYTGDENGYQIYKALFKGTDTEGTIWSMDASVPMFAVSVIFDTETGDPISQEPIQLEDAPQTSVENVSEALDIRVVDGSIMINTNEEVAIYNVEGKILYKTIANGEMTINGMPKNQALIVRIGDKAAKVIL
ncbi:MAG: hypothetical protein ACI3Z5_02090 [Paludibacteraceae bacterium]